MIVYGLYTAVLGAGLLGYLPLALWRGLVRGVPLRLGARLGYSVGPVSGDPVVWVHAVSVGEVMAAAPLVERLRRARPDVTVVLTTVTDTGARVVRERLAHLGVVHRFFPLDLPGAVRRVVEALHPALFVAVETELWPNVFRHLRRRGVPVMIANGRLSDRSYRRYQWVRPLLGRVLAGVRVFAMQSEEDARRVIALGAPPDRVLVTGNLKYEPLPDPAGGVELWRRLLGLTPGRPVWVAGSTHRGEDEAVLEAHAQALREDPELTLIVAPRHPERVPEVVGLVQARGWQAVRRSALPRVAGPRLPDGAPPVIVLDTVGELAQLYGVADVVFMGGSLVPVGGHNMLEPALRRKPILVGPHTENFRDIAALLVEAGGALVVSDSQQLAAELARLLRDPSRRAAMGTAAAQAAASRQGAVEATVQLLLSLLDERGEPTR
jgi:3-deoxy-D-manno-octulosonic-acid transferase